MPAVRYSNTAFIGNGQYYGPLPVRPVESGATPHPDTFLDCLVGSVRICANEFTGAAFRSCLYGMLTTSNLLPTGVARASSWDVLDLQGGYSAGRQLYCPYNSVGTW
jgi:hypothetical protein